MFGLGKLFAALARLAGALEGMASTVESADTRLRQQLGFADGPVRVEALSEPEPADEQLDLTEAGPGNGRKRPARKG